MLTSSSLSPGFLNAVAGLKASSRGSMPNLKHASIDLGLVGSSTLLLALGSASVPADDGG
jgi:hypothetical protein